MTSKCAVFHFTLNCVQMAFFCHISALSLIISNLHFYKLNFPFFLFFFVIKTNLLKSVYTAYCHASSTSHDQSVLAISTQIHRRQRLHYTPQQTHEVHYLFGSVLLELNIINYPPYQSSHELSQLDWTSNLFITYSIYSKIFTSVNISKMYASVDPLFC